MKLMTCAALVLAGLFSLSVAAGPAPWYQWQSKLNGKLVCAQTSPGEGWVQLSGPYKDPRCQ